MYLMFTIRPTKYDTWTGEPQQISSKLMYAFFLEIKCPPLSPPAHGSISAGCDTSLGSTCQFSCDDGYFLDKGSSERTCQENAQWDASEAVCSGLSYHLLNL